MGSSRNRKLTRYTLGFPLGVEGLLTNLSTPGGWYGGEANPTALLLSFGSKTSVFDTSCAGYGAARRQAGPKRCGYSLYHPGIAVTGADDQLA